MMHKFYFLYHSQRQQNEFFFSKSHPNQIPNIHVYNYINYEYTFLNCNHKFNYAGNFVAEEKQLLVILGLDISKSMWVFGYGSLIWKADFPFKTKVVGYIKGYKRRFYQHSVDHRGRPNKPGRVVTLIPSHVDDFVWGVAYEIHKRHENYVTAHLDYREKTGYKKHQVIFYPTKIDYSPVSEDGDNTTENFEETPANFKLQPFELIIYIGTEDNKWFAGPASIEEIAQQIYESEGPSGTNKEYLYNLAKAMRRMAPDVNDEHLFALEKAVLNLEKLKNPTENNCS